MAFNLLIINSAGFSHNENNPPNTNPRLFLSRCTSFYLWRQSPVLFQWLYAQNAHMCYCSTSIGHDLCVCLVQPSISGCLLFKTHYWICLSLTSETPSRLRHSVEVSDIIYLDDFQLVFYFCVLFVAEQTFLAETEVKLHNWTVLFNYCGSLKGCQYI